MTNLEQATHRFQRAQVALKLAAEELVIATDEAIASTLPGIAPALFRSIRVVQRIVAEHHGIDLPSMLGTQRPAPLVAARHRAIAICRDLLDVTQEVLARAFCRDDHGTVVQAVKAVRSRRETEPKYDHDYKLLTAQCKAALSAP
jgi:chromosomal replication initiation ATPase DnaA